MSLMGKVEGETEIKASAKDFHEIFSCKPHHVSGHSPDNIQGCDLHEGEWGKPGSIVYWNYVHDGKASVAKERVEAIDDEKNSTTFNVIEGDLLKLYKTIVITVQATPKHGGSGSVVQWTLEYEKLNANIPDPKTLLEFVINVTKDIDAKLCQA